MEKEGTRMSLQVNVRKQLGDFSLQAEIDTEGKWHGILGASGCGKSMTLKMIAGIEKPDSGRIVLGERVLFDSAAGIDLPPQQRRVGYLFQNYALFPNMTVLENIKCGLRRDGRTGSAGGRTGTEAAEHSGEGPYVGRSARNGDVDELMAMLELTELKDRYPAQLSGGQQQRTALARCLAGKPEAMLLDEPFSALDEFLKERLQQDVKSILASYPGEVMLVSHSRDEVYRFCECITILDRGQMVASGRIRDVFDDPVHVTAARLSGCKNISRARRTGEYEVLAEDWNVRLKTCRPVSKNIEYVGIRAHDISAGKSSANSVSVTPAEMQDDLFEMNAVFHCGSGKIWWKTAKKDWRSVYLETMPEYLTLPPEKLLLLEDGGNNEKDKNS